MTDIVSYGIPLGVLGQLANAILVKKQLKEIFEYRALVVEKKWPVSSVPKGMDTTVVFS